MPKVKLARNGFDSGSNLSMFNESPDQGAYNHGPVAQPGIVLQNLLCKALGNRAPVAKAGLVKSDGSGETFNQVVASPKQPYGWRKSRPAHLQLQ